MAGALFGIPLSQWRNADGTPMAGAKLYIYAAGTSTPADTFQDYGLTVGLELTHPIIADANGLIPMFWVADGAYRARLTNSTGSLVLFDSDGIQAIGPSSGEGGGGGGVSATAIFQTGDTLWGPISGTRSGWVRHNARTIGSASSGASERANADTQALYEFLWNNYSDTLCPVTGGRGASGAADFAANKPMATLDLRGKAAFGLADMGNSDNGSLDNVTFDLGSKIIAASQGGDALHLLTTGESGQKAISAAPVAITDPGHLHAMTMDTVNVFAGSTGPGVREEGSSNTASATTGITAALTLAGSSAVSAHNNMPPFILGSWYVKL